MSILVDLEGKVMKLKKLIPCVMAMRCFALFIFASHSHVAQQGVPKGGSFFYFLVFWTIQIMTEMECGMTHLR